MNIAVLEQLGISTEELKDRVVDQLVEKLSTYETYDEDGNEHQVASSFRRQLDKEIERRIHEKVEQIGAEHVLPKLTDMLENFCLQKTNEWGEKKGEALSFTEYLVKAAHEYMTEQVDFAGKSKSEDRFGSWRGNTTRVAYMIDRHLQYSIEVAMQQALKHANESIVEGINKAVQIRLKEIVGGIKATVMVKG